MKILLWPNASLKQVCEPVDSSDPDFRGQLEEMKKLMLAGGGIGLAANQVGLKKRMLVAIGDQGPQYFVNPRIVGFTGEWVKRSEGCLSLPGVVTPHRRNTEVLVESLDLETGAIFVQTYEKRLGHILQHEIDHLDGRMMIDHLPGAERDRVRQHMKSLRGR